VNSGDIQTILVIFKFLIMKISIIVAMTEKRVIGKNNRLPWHIPEDFRWFKKITIDHPVIMGRKTFESIGKPLPGRKNYVITRQMHYRAPGAVVCRSLEEAIEKSRDSTENEIFIIGGESIYKDALKLTNRIYLTLIHKEYSGYIAVSDVGLKANFSSRGSPVPADVIQNTSGANPSTCSASTLKLDSGITDGNITG